MSSEQALKIISIIVFLAGIICLGGVLYYVFVWAGWEHGWDMFYTWLLIIGIPCLVIGTILVNKYLR